MATDPRAPARFTNVGVDTGGTFTDLVLIDDAGVIRTEKAFSTPAAPERGIFDVLARAAAALNTSVADILARTETLAHGTTVSTNALIQRRGAKVGMLFTAGFEDTLAIGRGPIGRVGGLPQSRAMDFLHTEPPPPLVPRAMVRGVHERIGPDGAVVTPLVEDSVVRGIEALLADGMESLAVCLLWSFRNPAHESRVGEIARRLAPGLPVSLSMEIAPKMGEFERAVTTAVNAFIGPVTEDYVTRLDDGLRAEGLRTPVQVITSRGGAARAASIGRQAVSVVNSGPVGGLVAARFLGDALGHDRIITADMGGTSFDVGLIDGDRLEEDPRPFLDHGLPVTLPAVKLVTIGAGGGSIAWTDGQRLQVGPESAGAEPGPAAYGRGGTEPTVTDALIVCGLIDPANFYGGNFALDRDLAERAIADRIGGPLGLSTEDAAAGIIELVNAKMADLIRKVSIESGYDPNDFVLYAYGGATAAHCAAFAAQLGMRRVVIPYAAPVFSALGVAIADIVYAHAQSVPLPLRDDSLPAVNAAFADLRARADDDMAAAGLDPATCRYRHRIEMRYRDQMNEVTLDWPEPELRPGDADRLREAFEAYYETRFGRGTTRPATPLELISFRVEAIHPTARPALGRIAARPATAAAPRRGRVYARGAGWTDIAVHDFTALAPGRTIVGPAVIERDTTTVWLPRDASATLDDYGNLVLDTRGNAGGFAGANAGGGARESGSGDA